MFKQVYFHKTRMAFDIHLQHVMTELLPRGCFPPPDREGLNEYLKWDDWRVLGLLANGEGGQHAKRMLDRKQYRQVYRSKEKPPIEEVLEGEKARAERVASQLVGMEVEIKPSQNRWYKQKEGSSITIVNEENPRDIQPLSEYSPIASLNAGDQYFIYVKPEDAQRAREIIRSFEESGDMRSLNREAGTSEGTISNANREEIKANKKPPAGIDAKDPQNELILARKDIPSS